MSSHPVLDPPEEAVVPAAEGDYRSAVARTVHGVARALREGSIGPGEAADLRRLRPDDPASPAFWRIVTQYVSPRLERRLTDEDERRWAVILNALAHLERLDEPGLPLGTALRDAGFSELRFVRLLRAESERLADTVRKTARFLASKGQPANLAHLADLVLSEGRNDADRVRRSIARTYFQPTKND